jgi:hypothetical protein
VLSEQEKIAARTKAPEKAVLRRLKVPEKAVERRIDSLMWRVTYKTTIPPKLNST